MSILIGTLTPIVVLILLLAVIGRRITEKMGTSRKKWWLTSHILSVAVYFSGLLGTLLLAELTTTVITDQEQIYAAHLCSKYCDWFLIIPGAFASLITGVWLSIRTHWGLTRYYWIIVKTLGHIGAILFGSTSMRVWFEQTIALSMVGQANPLHNPAYFANRQMLIAGTVFSLALLTFLVAVSVFKPWGKRITQDAERNRQTSPTPSAT